MNYSNNKSDNSSFPFTKIVVIVGLVLALVVGISVVKVRTIDGDEMAVLEDWNGVRKEPIGPGTYFFVMNPLTHGQVSVYPYKTGMQLYVMNDKDNGEEIAEGRIADAYVVQSSDQQDMRISMRMQWKRRPDKLVNLHMNSRKNVVEENIIRTPFLNIVKNQATLRTALDAYSGPGLVSLQDDILKNLRTSKELNDYIEVVDQIVARQVAVQERLKNIEQTKAAEAAAEKAKAVAQADYEKTLVEARRDKEKGILDAERIAQQNVLRAEADAKQAPSRS